MNMRRLLIYQALPLAVLLLPFVWVAVFDEFRSLKREDGIIENLTVVFLLVAIGFCVNAMLKLKRLAVTKSLRIWLALLILGSLYFALEELSYGQHMFGWETGETWSELNDQEETNLHNVLPLFDQLPRTLLTLGVLIGGIILPLYRYFRKITLDESNRFYWQWPTIDCVTVGLLVILIRPLQSVFDFEFINTGETKEFFFAVFILLYCISIQTRLKRKVVDSELPTSSKPGELSK